MDKLMHLCQDSETDYGVPQGSRGNEVRNAKLDFVLVKCFSEVDSTVLQSEQDQFRFDNMGINDSTAPTQ